MYEKLIKRFLSFVIYLYFCLFFSLQSNALVTSPEALHFTHITKSQGLPDNSVTVTYQDKQGLIWMGTPSGLVRYDGQHMTHWNADPEKLDSLSNPHVTSLVEDDRKNLWVGTVGGLNKIDLKTEILTRIQMPESLSVQERRIWGLAINKNKIWIATHHYLFLYDPALKGEQAFKKMPIEAEPNTLLRSIISDNQNGVWAAFGSRVSHLNSDEKNDLSFDCAEFDVRSPKVNFAVRNMVIDDEQNLWLSTQTAVQIWDISGNKPKLSPLSQQLKLPVARSFSILLDENKSIWIGYAEGEGLIHILKGTHQIERYKHHPSIPSSLIHDTIASLYQDRSGVLWVGTWDNGISLVDLRYKGFVNYLSIPELSNSLSNNTVMSIRPDHKKGAWIGTYGGGLNYLNLETGDVQRYTKKETTSLYLKAVLERGDGRIWLGGDDGLVIFDPRTKSVKPIKLQEDTPGGKSISSLLLDRYGNLWVGSAAGLYQINKHEEVRAFKTKKAQTGALKHDSVDAIFEDKLGRLWIGTKGGLFLFNHETNSFSQPVIPNSDLQNPSELSIYCIFEDTQNRLWLGTSVGLYQLIRDKQNWHVQSWRKINGMPKGWILSIQEAADGALWLGGEQGLIQLNIEHKSARGFSSVHGVISSTFNFGASNKTMDGVLLFGGLGILAFKPVEIQENKAPIKIVLSDILVFNRSVSSTGFQSSNLHRFKEDELRDNRDSVTSLQELGIHGLLRDSNQINLSPKQAMISFEFSGLYFHNRQDIRYAWKLDGFDKEWIYGRPGDSLATYTNLDQGSYTLKVKVSNPAGVWGEDAFALPVYVSPPVWKSWWFQFAIFFTFCSLLVLTYRSRVSKLRKLKERLEYQIKERTQVVLQQKEQLMQEKEIAEQQREAAEKARLDITLLSEIGRKISSSLDIESIQNVFYDHVAQLIGADIYGIGMVDWVEHTIVFERVMDCGCPVQKYSRSLQVLNQPAAQCVIEAKELLIKDLDIDNRIINQADGQRGITTRIDGKPVSRAKSGLYVPMEIENKVIGVITVLSLREQAYDENHLTMLRTLSAYVTVALDKAAAHEGLKITQTKLVQQEKLAALGSLVAGVAHELNTPIGNSLLVASSLKARNNDFLQLVDSGLIKRSEIKNFCSTSDNAIAIIVRNLETSAHLVSSFKQIAYDQTSDQRSAFNLRKFIEKTIATLTDILRTNNQEVQLDIPPDISIDSFPDALGQVISHLIENASIHGIAEKADGIIFVAAHVNRRQYVVINFIDNGRGIPSNSIGRVFEPFFTTRLGQGSSGLGLHICYNLVSSVLGGSISVQSIEGGGATFTLEIPLRAPD